MEDLQAPHVMEGAALSHRYYISFPSYYCSITTLSAHADVFVPDLNHSCLSVTLAAVLLYVCSYGDVAIVVVCCCVQLLCPSSSSSPPVVMVTPFTLSGYHGDGIHLF